MGRIKAKVAKRERSTSRAPTEIDQLVGARLRKLRLDCDITLLELGREIGVSHQQLQKYETGVNRLSAGMLSRISMFFQVPIEDFFLDANAHTQKARDPLQSARIECHSLIERTKSEEKIHAMVKVLKALASS